jgi:hypothetical protein
MRNMRRVGAAVMAVAVFGVGAAGCGGDDTPREKATASDESIDQLNKDLGYGDDSGDAVVDESEEEPSDEYPDTKASLAFDTTADAKGWEAEGYTQASEYVLMMCESMDSWEPGAAETLAKNQVPEMTAGMKRVLKEGAKPLCPQHATEIAEALGGSVSVRTMSSGTYTIKQGGGLSAETAPPGTYRATGDLADCYWERTTKGGDILANHFATAAKSITVTVNAGELFTSRDCGTWAQSP